MTFSAFVAILTLHMFAAISPGPAVLMAARTGVTEGLRTGAMLALGIGVGAAFWAVMAVFGLSVLFEYAPFLLTTLKIVGGAYLIYMAWKMWKSATVPMDMNIAGRPPRTLFSAFWLGVTTQLSNPKPVVFFGAVFVGMIPQGTPVWVIAALLFWIIAIEAIWNTIVARIFSFERTRKGYISLKTVMDRCFGGLLALLGLKIATT